MFIPQIYPRVIRKIATFSRIISLSRFLPRHTPLRLIAHPYSLAQNYTDQIHRLYQYTYLPIGPLHIPAKFFGGTYHATIEAVRAS